MIARDRAWLAREVGIDPHEVATAMGAALGRHCPVIATRTGRRLKAVQDLANQVEIERGIEETGGPVHPVVELLLLLAAAQREGVPRERALAPLDLAERLVGRVAVDRPDHDTSTPAGVLSALSAGLRDINALGSRLAAMTVDGVDEAERLQLPELRALAEAGMAAVLRAVALAESVPAAPALARGKAQGASLRRVR